jgi:hypothetical protein
MATIHIDKLEKQILLLLTKLKERKGVKVELENDYYWSIDSKELYNPTEEPKDLTLGQISFDWDRLENAKPDDLIPYDFERVSNILKALANEHPIIF